MNFWYPDTNEEPSMAINIIAIEDFQHEQPSVLLTEEEKKYFETVKQVQIITQSLAARYALAQLLKSQNIAYEGIAKNEYKQPLLLPFPSKAQVSFSHTTEYAAAGIHPHKKIGIDMEIPREKLRGIIHKYLSETELAFVGNDLFRMTLLWTAKEALYKCYGLKSLRFASQMQVILTELEQDIFPKNIRLLVPTQTPVLHKLYYQVHKTQIICVCVPQH